VFWVIQAFFASFMRKSPKVSSLQKTKNKQTNPANKQTKQNKAKQKTNANAKWIVT